MEPKNNFWIVGANWSGRDMTDTFIKRGYWEMGYDDIDKPEYAKLRSMMKVEDRIAIKSMLGKGARNIRIKAIGIIKDVDKENGRIYVNWILSNLDRNVPAKGCFGTIHRPVTERHTAEWINSVFCI